MKSIETHVRAFLPLNISVVGSVCGNKIVTKLKEMYQIFLILHPSFLIGLGFFLGKISVFAGYLPLIIVKHALNPKYTLFL